MSSLNNKIYLDFLQNKKINHFFLSIFIMSFGGALINIFVPIYLYTLNFEIYQIIFFYFLVSLNFVIFSYYGAKITAAIGEKHAILASIPFLILYNIGLIFINSNKIIFLFYLYF